jgi:hypothetical protein
MMARLFRVKAFISLPFLFGNFFSLAPSSATSLEKGASKEAQQVMP